MKNSILTFIKFYLTVPIFVLFTATIGGVILRAANAASYNIPEEVPEHLSQSIFENGLFPADMLEELPYLSETMHPIIAKTIDASQNILNETSYKITEEKIAENLPDYEKIGKEPFVLVIHTHGTECYFDPEEKMNVYYADYSNIIEGYYDEKKTKTRSENTDENVVAVGRVFCATLENCGIPAIHCEDMFDLEDYNTAYSKSGNAISQYLEKYPSIRLVIDLHRDSLISDELVKIKTVAKGLSQKSAQVMIVAGSDAGGSYYPTWERNLALDLKIKEVMDEKYPSLSRPIFLRGARYNQHLAYTSFLLEVGTCANTLEEAAFAATLSAECIAEAIKTCH